MRRCWYALVIVLAVMLAPASIVRAQDYDFDWVTIGAVGNPAYDGPDIAPFRVTGRGQVDYAFRASRLEMTTGQWVEFVNTFSTLETPPPFFDRLAATFWGAGFDPDYDGPGYRYRVGDEPNAAMRPVSGITWRMAGLYCNWLHNGKQTSPDSLITGAYDTTTWGSAPGGAFTDAWTHLPDARFWIPTLDEYMKAQHYDPDRYGPGLGGWWLDKNGSDEPGIPGPPRGGNDQRRLRRRHRVRRLDHSLGRVSGLAIPLGAPGHQRRYAGMDGERRDHRRSPPGSAAILDPLRVSLILFYGIAPMAWGLPTSETNIHMLDSA